jgi:hypothetical protein
MHRAAGALLVAACAVLTGCRGCFTPPNPPAATQDPGPARLVRLDELTDAEKRYGRSARSDPRVTYQPGVVVPAAGAAAVRGTSDDGLVWILDPEADGAEAIVRGKVLLLTNRAAGRVLDVQKGSDGLRVVLGPVEITEVVREGRFHLEQPLDFEQVLSFDRPAVFDPVQTVEPLMASAEPPPMFGYQRAGFMSASSATVHRFTLTPIAGAKGIGVRIASDAGGVQFMGEAFLFLKAPTLKFHLQIDPPGRIVECYVEVTGAAGLHLLFHAGSPKPYAANINEKRYTPADFSIPLAGTGVPFAVTVRQIFQLKTAFTSTGVLKANGVYQLTGGFRAGYSGGQFSLTGPGGFGAKETLLPVMNGVAVGVTGMVMTHHINVIVGLGSAGFVAGPYVYLNSSVAVTRGSSIPNFHVVGYTMPAPVTAAINSILRALHIKEEIKGSGGIETNPKMIAQAGWYAPKMDICGK